MFNQKNNPKFWWHFVSNLAYNILAVPNLTIYVQDIVMFRIILCTDWSTVQTCSNMLKF